MLLIWLPKNWIRKCGIKNEIYIYVYSNLTFKLIFCFLTSIVRNPFWRTYGVHQSTVFSTELSHLALHIWSLLQLYFFIKCIYESAESISNQKWIKDDQFAMQTRYDRLVRISSVPNMLADLRVPHSIASNITHAVFMYVYSVSLVLPILHF